MDEFKHLVTKISDKDSSKEQMEEVTCIINNLFEDLKNNHIDVYNKYILQLEDITYRISEEKAKEIVKAMRPYGEKWDFDKVKELVEYNGIENYFVEYYLVLNMAYNDYYDLAKSVDKENDTNFYFQLAKNFINDRDAKPHKVAKYFL